MKRPPLKHPPALTFAALVLLTSVFGGCAYLVRSATLVYLNVNAMFSSQEIEIEVNKSFIEKYKDRVSITATFTVDKARQNPIARMFDGDFHMAGRAPEVALPVVAEIANGASAKKAIDLVHGAEGTGKPLKISGVWRIWPEHGGSAKQDQGEPLLAMESDNPSHVFEIHPVTRINDVGVLDTFTPIEGFMGGDAHNCFEIYDKVPCTLTVKPKAVSIVTHKGLRNDVEFLMEITDGRQIVVPGGRFVIASARDLKGNLLVERLRIVFATDTPPERAVRLLKRGDRLHVFGLPRVDFAEISRRVRGSQKDPALLVKPLPYEIIIQGVYKDKK
ncbi:MAG: hypothetical protein ABSG19_11240 [Candidatus Aminicenantales bacterium]